METKLKIYEAALKVLENAGNPLSVKEIYNKIISESLFDFKAEDAMSVLRVELKRHSEGVEYAKSPKKKYFLYDETNGKFSVLQENSDNQPNHNNDKNHLSQLRRLYESYLTNFKSDILSQLKKMNPYDFEEFCKQLISTYGFNDAKVTQKSRDGGIDGTGKLKVGIAQMNVAFQCKRFKNTPVGRNEIDKFRGAIQGEYEQGIFFTTSHFSKEALNASIKQGAVPIILIDGDMIVDFMIEKQFGIEHEDMPIYINAMDRIFS